MTRAFSLACILLLAACDAGSPGNDLASDRPAGPAPADRAGSEPAPAAASPTIPLAFRGRWDASPAACAGSGSEMELEVGADRLDFHESLARVEAARTQGPERVDLDLLVEGEGEVRRETRTLRLLSPDRLEMSFAGTTATRIRCGAGPDAAGWIHQASGEGDGLSLSRGGRRLVTLFCPAESDTLLVNVPAFRPIASEERMSFGSGGTVTILVADTSGDRLRGGVSGSGQLPSELEAILASRSGLAVNYGAQNAGPFDPLPSGLAATFLSGCRD